MVNTMYIISIVEDNSQFRNQLREFLERYEKENQAAFEMRLFSDGVDFLDGTYNGMGRGAGNCSIENLIGCLKNPKYSIYPVIKFIE